MDAVLCLWETTHFQLMELERPEAICGLESGTPLRLWSTQGHCPCGQEGAFFGLRFTLDRQDVDLAEGTLQVRQSKFGKSRWVPLHPSTCGALKHNAIDCAASILLRMSSRRGLAVS